MSKIDEILELTRVRVTLFLREPEAVFWTFVFPLILAAVLGFAFRKSEVDPSRVGILEGEGSAVLAQQLEGVENLEIELIASREEAAIAMRKGTLDALLGPGDPPELRYDPNRPEAEITRLRVEQGLGDETAARDREVRLEPAAEVGSRYIDFLFPGLLGMNLMGTGMFTIGFAVADLRQKKVLKRLLVTPMNRGSFLLSFLLARLVFLGLELAVLVSFGIWILGVPFHGGALAFLAISIIGAFVFSGLGLLSVSRARTIQGASGVLNLVMMPMWLCSGVFFSYERFPEPLHPFLAALPLSALNDALRALLLDGQGLFTLGREALVLVIWGLAAFFAALKIFRWD